MSSSQLTFIFFRGVGIPPTRLNTWFLGESPTDKNGISLLDILTRVITQPEHQKWWSSCRIEAQCSDARDERDNAQWHGWMLLRHAHEPWHEWWLDHHGGNWVIPGSMMHVFFDLTWPAMDSSVTWSKPWSKPWVCFPVGGSSREIGFTLW